MKQTPRAEKLPFMVMSPFGNRLDDYYWLRDDSKTSKASEIIDYLSAENEFTRVELIDTKLREEILLELLRKAPRVSRSFLQSSRNHWYWMEQSVDAEHPKIVRTTSLDIEITVLIDLKVRARDSAYFRVGSFCVSPDEKYIAWTEDTKGNRAHTLCVMSLHDGRVLPHEVYGVLENIVWDHLCSRHIFYIFQNPKITSKRHGSGARYTARTKS